MRFEIGLLLVAVGVSAPVSMLAATYVVRPDGNGDFATIQAAVYAVLPGYVIELTDGTFRGEGNRDVRYLGKAITIRSESGDPEACIVDCEGSSSEFHRGFLFDQAESSGSILQGVTVRNGHVFDDGGAVYLSYYDASPVIDHCWFLDNTSEGNGGALRLTQYRGSPTVSNCTFTHNHAVGPADGGGGAICAGWCGAAISGCTFTSNSADKYGGAVRLWPGSSASFSFCEFRDNQAMSGGAVHSGSGYPTFTDCVMSSNHADVRGGALALTSQTSAAPVTRCLFAGNSAPEGGAIFAVSGSPHINQSTFYGNSAAAGSGIYCYGGEYQIWLQNCIVAFGQGSEGLACGEYCDAGYHLACCDIFANAGGDWVGCIADQYGIEGNFSEDPEFCDTASGTFTIEDCSPCLPGHHPDGYDCGGPVGAYEAGCGCGQTTEPTSWGAIKAIYR